MKEEVDQAQVGYSNEECEPARDEADRRVVAPYEVRIPPMRMGRAMGEYDGGEAGPNREREERKADPVFEAGAEPGERDENEEQPEQPSFRGEYGGPVQTNRRRAADSVSPAPFRRQTHQKDDSDALHP